MDAGPQSLVELARDRSRAARNKLCENLTDLFLSDAGRLNEHERALMSDILSKLLETVEDLVKKELSEVISRSDIELPEIVEMLASESIDIARPILEKSSLLKDPVLIDIIRKRTDEHRLAIALREGISEEVSDALIELGGDDVIETLIRNADAAISRSAMEYLVAESRRVDRFQEPLVNREDLPTDLAYRMYWWVSAALRRQIVTDFQVDEVALDEILTKATGNVIVDQQQTDGAYVRAQKLVRRMAESGELTHKFLLQVLRQQRIPVFVAGLGELAGIGFSTAWEIFSDRSGETLAILAKAIGIDRNDFTAIFLLISEARDGEKVHATTVLRSILDLYDVVDPTTAKAALQYWRQDESYQTAIDDLKHVQTG